jgi:hypothetical protein
MIFQFAFEIKVSEFGHVQEIGNWDSKFGNVSE